MNNRTATTISRTGTVAAPRFSLDGPLAGIAMFGADSRLVACSACLEALCAYPAPLLTVGTPLEAWVRFEAERGDYGVGDVDTVVRERLELLRAGEPSCQEHTLDDGRVLLSRSERALPGGLALSYEEVSVAHRATDRPGGDQHTAIENLRLSGELRTRTQELREALERQAAADQVLKTISRSNFELQPVLDALLENAVRLCAAESGAIYEFDGTLLRLAAAFNVSSEFKAFVEKNPLLQGRGTAAGRAALERRTVHIPDVAADGDYRYPASYTVGTIRSILGVPMLKEGAPVGVMTIWRSRVRPFTERQIDLLGAFGDQAAIAIENVRLLRELQVRNRDLTDALEQQTATAEILRVISRSPADLAPVFDAVARNAAALCDAPDVLILRIERDVMRLAASTGRFGETFARDLTIPVTRGSVAGRAVLERHTLHVHDLAVESADEYPTGKSLQERYGHRTMVATPLLRGDAALGVVVVLRPDVRPFGERQLGLLQVFADQAVIAIENARLFNEIKEALEQQTATADILRVISSSPTSTAPVFTSILESGTRLCGADIGILFSYEAGVFYTTATRGVDAVFQEFLRQPIRHPGPKTGLGRIGQTKKTVHIPDLIDDIAYRDGDPLRVRSVELGGVRTWLGVPMLREGELLGAIAIYRKEVRPFEERQVALLETFADQAVIAIENVRLFNELQARNHDLSEALEQQTATAEILRVISSSPTDVGPVLQAVARTAAHICDASDALIFRIDGGVLHHAAHHGSMAVDDGPIPVIDRATVNGRSMVDRKTIHVHDLASADETEFPLGRAYARRLGFRTAVSTPLLREGNPVGTIHIRRTEVRPFSDKQIKLLETFAHQAAIAIENARLFNELQARNRELTEALEQQTATSDILRVISQSPTDVQPVFETIAQAALTLCGARSSNVLTYDGKLLHGAALAIVDPDGLEAIRRMYPREPDRGTVSGRVILARDVVAISDVLEDQDYLGGGGGRQAAIAGGFRSMLGVPLMREGNAIGAIVVGRPEAGAFPESQVALLKTFADQAVIAIENVRLFNEIREKSAQLELASRHKSQFLANMSHELRTPLNAIIGFTRIVMRRAKDQLETKQYENLEKILASGLNLLALINAILDLSKIEAGRVEVYASEVELGPMLEQCVLTVEPLVKSDAVTLATDFEGALPTMLVDEEKLRQIIINLLSNAAKFTARGSIRLRAEATGERVCIAVADTGIGIAEDKLDKIFEEFEQADASSTRQYGGTGLGLAIARRLARLMGGEIEAASVPGAGSTFKLTLPLRYHPAQPT